MTSVWGWRKSTCKRLWTKRRYYSWICLERFRINTTGLIQELTFLNRSLTPGARTEYDVATRGSVPSHKKYDASSYEWRTFKMQQIPWLFRPGKHSTTNVDLTWQKIRPPPAQALQSLVDLGLQHSPHWQALRWPESSLDWFIVDKNTKPNVTKVTNVTAHTLQ